MLSVLGPRGPLGPSTVPCICRDRQVSYPTRTNFFFHSGLPESRASQPGIIHPAGKAGGQAGSSSERGSG